MNNHYHLLLETPEANPVAGMKWLHGAYNWPAEAERLGSLRGGQRIAEFTGDENMQTILPSDFKRQMVLMLEGSPHIIEDLHTSGTAQTRHKLHTRLRQLTTGRLIDRVFAENERVQVAQMEIRRYRLMANGENRRL